MATSLDYFIPNISNPDTRRRMTTYDELVKYLSNHDNSTECADLEAFVDGLNSWIDSSNYKISQNGMEITILLIERIDGEFRNHIASVLTHVVDRLGDNKDPVRQTARSLLLKLMNAAQTPQYVMERLTPSFSHKLWRVREELLLCVQQALIEFGAKSFLLSKTLPAICKLLEDANAPVRDAATALLVEMYRCVGERMRTDIMKREIHPSKLSGLLAKMDDVRDSGGILATDDAADDVDFAKPAAPKPLSTAAKRSTKSAGPAVSRQSSASSSSGKEAGAVDKETFMKAFEDVSQVMIFSGRDITDKMSRIRDTLSDANLDWEKRSDALKEIRSLLLAGAKEYEEFSQQLKSYSACLCTSVKDLRSQVVREACFTIAYLSQELLNKFDAMAEVLLPPLIGQIPNSAKIMSTSASTCIRFILQHTHAPRLIPIIAGQLTSKAAVIRRECCDFIDLVLKMWPTHYLEKHIALLQDVIKKGISDADPDARQISRRAFWSFAEHFRDQAESLRTSLDPAKQKQLDGTMSNSSSNNSLYGAGGGFKSSAPPTSKIRLSSAATSAAARNRSVSTERNNASNVTSRQLSLPGGSGASRVSSVSRTTPDNTDGASVTTDDSDAASSAGIVRSSSAADLARVAANVRPSLASTANRAAASNSNYYSLPRPRKSTAPSTVSAANTKTLPTPEHRRSKARTSGVSQSQPSSRSGSPNSRQLQQGGGSSSNTSSTPGHHRRRTAGAQSQGASRETSPSRHGHHDRRPSVPNQRSDMSDALSQAAMRLQPRHNGDQDYDDNASETSSVCSERSFTSRSRLPNDMSEVVKLLTSGSWADRKEGLILLQNFVHNNRQLTRSELKKLTEIFTRMFNDPHGKVLSVFFDTLIDLAAVYKFELLEWLSTLLTRLLTKMGAEMLGSLLVKAQRTLDVVRDTFPVLEQFNIIMRFIIDQSHTPNVKVKAAILNYITALSADMSASDFVNNSDTRLAVSRIITWTTEPKSTEVRKAAQSVLIALFNLNVPEFSMLLTGLPKTFQDGATKILHSHVRAGGSGGSDVSGPLTPCSPTGQSNARRSTSTYNHRHRADDMGTENMNPDDIYQSIKQTSADIQNLSLWDGGSSSRRYEHHHSARKETSHASVTGQGHVAGRRRSSGGDSGGSGALAPEVKDGSLMHRFLYDPHHYQDRSGKSRPSAGAPGSLITDQLMDELHLSGHTDTMADIITELSMHNSRHEERKTAMHHLLKLCRTEQPEEMWLEHFKNVLLLLLETLNDDDAHIRALTLRVLREMLRSQAERFRGYLELTTLKVLEAHRDTEKEVTRSAEECAATLASVVNTDQCLHVLGPIITTAQFPVCLAAIKMATKVVEQAPRDVVLSQLKNLVPGVLKAYDNSESSVRKASVFCLVAMHFAVGDDLYTFLKDLNGSKLKLLNLYIKRAAGDRELSTATTSKTASPTLTFSDVQ